MGYRYTTKDFQEMLSDFQMTFIPFMLEIADIYEVNSANYNWLDKGMSVNSKY